MGAKDRILCTLSVLRSIWVSRKIIFSIILNRCRFLRKIWVAGEAKFFFLWKILQNHIKKIYKNRMLITLLWFYLIFVDFLCDFRGFFTKTSLSHQRCSDPKFLKNAPQNNDLSSVCLYQKIWLTASPIWFYFNGKLDIFPCHFLIYFGGGYFNLPMRKNWTDVLFLYS